MKESLTRLLSGIVYIILLITATSFSFNTFLGLFGFFLICCVSEFSKLLQINRLMPLVISIAAYCLFAFFHTSPTTEWLLLAATLFVMAKCILFLFNHKKPVDQLSKYVYLTGYVILPFILITKLPLGKIGYNPKIIISIFILVWTNDTFAYIVGKSVGKRKLFEKISPKKTVEGFVGGTLFAMLAGFLIAEYYVMQSVQLWIAIALIASIFGTLGDLIESKFKRLAGVKDSGTIMPGHGGILDRLDSVIFASPIIFLLFQIINYVS